MSNKRTAMINERDAELKAKMDYIRSSLGEHINKAKREFDNQVDDLSNEMRPEVEMLVRAINKLAKATRPKRAISLIRSDEHSKADLTSPMSYEWKEYDIDNGRLELILRNVEAQKVPQFVYKVIFRNYLTQV